MNSSISTATMFVMPFAIVMTMLLGVSTVQDLYIYEAHDGRPTRENWLSSTKWLFEVNSEKSVYTWASSSIIFLNAVILFMISMRVRQMLLSWLVLSTIFFFLSMDEAMSFHERMTGVVRQFVSTGGVFHFAWVIPAMIFCLIVSLSYIPFLMRLPRRTMVLIIVSGALAMEMIASSHADAYGTYTMTYQMLANLEEGLEGIGMVLFMYALLDFAFAQRILSLPAAQDDGPVGEAGQTQAMAQARERWAA